MLVNGLKIKNIFCVRAFGIIGWNPLVGYKPYIGKFDAVKESSCGWLQAGDDEIRKKLFGNRFALKNI